MRKYLNKVFIYLICFFILYVYFVTTKIVMIDKVGVTIGSLVYLLFFTAITFMLGWCLFKTMMTHPGKVPQNWGFYLDGNEQKRRRFCLVCHIFKPERCHHCSACNMCVLNMDHHCPWINNCVGFYNRKFFMQMLFYVILDSVFAFCGLLYGFKIEFRSLQDYLANQNDNPEFFSAILICSALFVSGGAIFLISRFFKMHLELVLENRTTIENLEKKRNEETGQQPAEVNPFDIGQYYNWVQVFGSDKILWFLPIQTESGRPAGDGILWPKRYQSESDTTKDAIISPNIQMTPSQQQYQGQTRSPFLH